MAYARSGLGSSVEGSLPCAGLYLFPPVMAVCLANEVAKKRAQEIGVMAPNSGCTMGNFFDPSLKTSDFIANCYEELQYGNIPTVSQAARAGGTPYPSPAAPGTQGQLTTPGAWTPEDSMNANAYLDSVRSGIQVAEDQRTYNPAGNIPTIPGLLGADSLGLIGLVVLGLVGWGVISYVGKR